MQIVREHIDTFTRGGDPYQKLGVGSHKPLLQVGDHINFFNGSEMTTAEIIHVRDDNQRFTGIDKSGGEWNFWKSWLKDNPEAWKKVNEAAAG